MKKLVIGAMVVLASVFSSSVMADPSDPPYPTEPYLNIVRYYDTTVLNQPPQLAGWDITYCDFTTESARYPGRNMTSIEVQEGVCLF